MIEETSKLHTPAPASWRKLRRQRGWQMAALLLLVSIAGLGCDPISMLSYFILPFSDDSIPPPCPLTIEGKESTVAFICHHENAAQVQMNAPRLKTADRDISSLLVRMLKERYKDTKENIKIVPTKKVYQFLDNEPNWISMSKKEIGKKLGADIVVDLEIGPISMVEKGSNDTLFSGTAEIRISVIEVDQPDGDDLKYQKIFTTTYPSTGPISSFEISTLSFQQKFTEYIAKGLMRYFASHGADERAGAESDSN